MPAPSEPRAAETGAQEAEEPAKAPEGICERKERTERTGPRWPAAFVLWNDIFFSYKFYMDDTFEGWPDAVPMPQAIIMAHELVHVWQWQNRDRTDYSPAASAGEAAEKVDPYYWQVEEDRPFLSYGFEQQAAMIEDYVCYQLFDPGAARAAELEAVIDPVLPLDGLKAELGR